ncbi:putative dipeptidyl-peptidase 1 [Triangularia setosa]|uniref:Dipeptidyl-peptidase 1 n=1 Tax=Triangularia setosa TaxID=2587417 RepID=A0AAN6W7H3_9PEZI|nr:putative dipeptidyl-peptidase 1 [Podospora setosa]
MALVELLLLSFLASVVDAIPPRRGVSWPAPVPVSSVPPIEWNAIGPSIYRPLRDASHQTADESQLTANKRPATAKINPLSNILPPVVDWRNLSGTNFITTPQDQGVCQSCWAFAVTALIESQVRIEHSIWSKRSEADIHDGIGAICETTGSAKETLRYVAGNTSSSAHESEKPGITDWSCDPYEAATTPHAHCSDRSGRTTHIGDFQAIGGIEDQKRWLHEYGPIVATFILYTNFGEWKPDPTNPHHVYAWDGTSGNTGNHIALVVGYDDERGAWIMKNSWGKGWGDDGFVYFAYDNANIDMWAKYGLRNVNPDPWTRRRHQNGNMMQSGNGETHRNFELLLSDPAKGTRHVSRDGDARQWSVVSQPTTSNEVPAFRGQPFIIGTSRNRDFHAVALTESNNMQQWAYTQSDKTWSQVSTFGQSKVDGYPGFVQSDDSSLIIVVKHTDETLNEYRQEVNSVAWTLIQPPIAGNITQSGASLVQSNIGLNIYDRSGSSWGHLYTVATRGDGKMQTFWREGKSNIWKEGEAFGDGIPGDAVPVMIQDNFDTKDETSSGGFQLVVAVNGSVEHWRWRPQMGEQWRMTQRVTPDLGGEVKQVWSLVQGSLVGKMHMLTESLDGRIDYWEWDEKWALVERWIQSVPVSGG